MIAGARNMIQKGIDFTRINKKHSVYYDEGKKVITRNTTIDNDLKRYILTKFKTLFFLTKDIKEELEKGYPGIWILQTPLIKDDSGNDLYLWASRKEFDFDWQDQCGISWSHEFWKD